MNIPLLSCILGLSLALNPAMGADAPAPASAATALVFDIKSVRDGAWSEPQTWEPARVPGNGERVLVSARTRVRYDAESEHVIRLLQVAGELNFARDRNTTLNVALLKVQNSERCSENGFRCDLHEVTEDGEPNAAPSATMAALTVGTFNEPIPAQFTARIRMHYLEGMNKDDAPSVSACSARMEFHGAPMSRTWVKLGAEVKPGDTTVTLAEAVTGWSVGDEVIVTGSIHSRGSDEPQTEERRITKIDGTTVTLDKPLANPHFGNSEFRSEVANLSRNVIVESADPKGVRGHTLYHQFSKGGISYARFAYLGKEHVLGRYPIHFHLVEDTMRGSGVIGASIVDSHNRWVTIHGTQYLVVRDCVGYRSVGHGFFMEDGTEAFNLLDRNLGVQAVRGKRLPKQVLDFDPNDGAAFWWSNGRNSLTRNVSCENEEYGFRYDSQSTRSFNSNLAVRTSDGGEQKVDVRTLPFYRFDSNEAHTEGLYGMVFAGNNQSGEPINKAEDFARLDRTGPDTRHPHIVRNSNIWHVHYGLRPQIPNVMLEHTRIAHATYGIYRPAFENHVYRDLTIAHTSSEPFNRGMDDASTQFGVLTVEDLKFVSASQGGGIPLIQMSDNNPTGKAESHFRNVQVTNLKDGSRRALVDRGGGARSKPVTERGVPVYLHDHFGPGRTAKFASTAALDLMSDGSAWQKIPSLTGKDAMVAEVGAVPFPKLLDPVDDLPPTTVITRVRREQGKVVVTGISHDNGDITSITVNGQAARVVASGAGVVDWEITLDTPLAGKVTATATDKAGNSEPVGHRWVLSGPGLHVADQ